MANLLKIAVLNPDDLLATNEYGAGALIRVERSATGGTGYAELGTLTILAAITSYTYSDASGFDGSWYRTRYSNAGNTIQSSYSDERQATSTAPSYAMLGPAKLRLGIADTDTTSDSLIQSFCDQVNDGIESKTGRILRPIPLVSTTITAGGAAGSQAVTLVTTVNIAAGDALLFGPVSGTHEHGIVTSVSGAVVNLQAPLVATYANGAAVQRCYLFDGSEALESGHLIPAPNGIISATSVEVGFYTGGSFNLIPTTDWFLRPLPLEREPGWPATELWMTDIPSSNNPAPLFFGTNWAYGAFGVVRVVGQMGWPAIMPSISGLALSAVTTLYRRRGVGGGGDMVQTGSDGARTISLLLDAFDWRTLNRLTSKEAVLI